jgi:hypothetical protein
MVGGRLKEEEHTWETQLEEIHCLQGSWLVFRRKQV